MRILSKFLCVDDYGSEVYLCNLINAPEHCDGRETINNSYYPGVKGTYVNAPDTKKAHRQAIAWFHESEANCNTCANLTRKKHDRRIDGFLCGVCQKTGIEIKFHPDDPMHMDCYIPRVSVSTDTNAKLVVKECNLDYVR